MNKSTKSDILNLVEQYRIISTKQALENDTKKFLKYCDELNDVYHKIVAILDKEIEENE